MGGSVTVVGGWVWLQVGVWGGGAVVRRVSFAWWRGAVRRRAGQTHGACEQ